jgi:hypothetical protein
MSGMGMNYSDLKPGTAQRRQCFDCDFETIADTGECPHCRGLRFYTATNIRIRGILLIICGLILTLGLLAVEVLFATLLSGPVKGTYGGLSAESKKAAIVLSMAGIGIILILGVVFTAGGVGMAINGKRNTRFVSLVVTLLTAGFVALGIAMAVFGQ